MNDFISSIQKKGQENYELSVKSLEAATKGMQEVSKEVADFSKKSLEDSSVAMKSIFSANSVEKALEAQGAYAKASYEAFVSEAKKLSEMYTSVAKSAYAPFEAVFAAK